MEKKMSKRERVTNLAKVQQYKRSCYVPWLSGVAGMSEEKALQKLERYVDAVVRLYRCPISDRIRKEGITQELTDKLIARDGKAVFTKDLDLYQNNRFKNMCYWYQLPTLNELSGCPAHYLGVCKQIGRLTVNRIDQCLIDHGFEGLVWDEKCLPSTWYKVDLTTKKRI
tara:strand:+ start:740 stop:1246 length:507 start_codon:yes stop_codon:yes gene_type:complete